MADNTKKGKGMLPIIIGGILTLILGVLALLITFNPGNINNTVLKNVPLLNNFIPKEQDKEELSLEEKYYDYSKPRLKEAVYELEKEKVVLDEKIKKLSDTATEKDKEIEKLKEFEKLYATLKAQTDEKTEKGSTPTQVDEKSFKEYYEKMNPEKAKDIYTNIIKQNIADTETKKYVSKLDSMNVQTVASVLDDMIKTEFDQVVKILNNMDEERSVKVMELMDIKNTTKITKKLTGRLK